MTPERMAVRSAMPTVPIIHFFFLSLAAIYGLKSSVPGRTGDRVDTDAALCIGLCRRDHLRGMGRCAKGLHLWPVSGPLSCHPAWNGLASPALRC